MKHFLLPETFTVAFFALCSASSSYTQNTAPAPQSSVDTLMKEPKFYQKPITREYLSLAKNYHSEENYEKALLYYKKVLEHDEHNFNALMSIATIHFIEKDFNQATDYYDQILALFPRCTGAYYNLGLCHLNNKKYTLAQDAFESALERDNEHSKAWCSLGVSLEAQELFAKSIEAYKKAIALDTTFVYPYVKLGQVYRHLHDLNNALSALEQAYQREPNNIHIIMELANTLNIMDHNERALELYMKALELDPTQTSALYNFGFTLRKKDRILEAITVYKKALESDPLYALAHFSLATALLTLGDFKQGLKEYEWRFAAYNEKQEKYTFPLWDGSRLNGKTILVYAEQGLGDTILFSRYIPMLIAQGAHVVFQVQNQLKKLFSLAKQFGTVIDRTEVVPPCDVQAPLMSLPYLCNTTLETIPTQSSYLETDPHLVSYWKSYLSHDDNFKVGICWQGNGRYPSHALQKLVEKKSIPLALLAKLSTIPGVSLYSLQRVDGCEQLKTLPTTYTVHQFGPDFDIINGSFIDTSAVMKNLDLVISVDTSIGHLAGSLGIPTWIVLPRPADWRWLMYRSDTPWYPSVRLFRQTIIDDWSNVISLIEHAVQSLVSTRKNISNQPKIEILDNSAYFNEALYISAPDALGKLEHELLFNELQRSLSSVATKKD
jgi:tetratricopeptide (TPR) repeat protein